MKNCKGKAPAFQFYVKDWLSDPELQKAHPTTRGIWINLLCYMWDAPDRGKLETNERELCQLGSCLLEDIKVFLFDAERLDFCDISVTCHADVTSSHADVTIENRRMIREQYERQKARTRKQKQREREVGQEQIEEQIRNGHGNVTPPSPIPTPVPTPTPKFKSKNKDLKPFVETSDEVRRNEFNFVVAQKIAEWTRSQKKVNITNGKITVWANQVRLLIEKDLRGEREEKEARINKALEWYLENAGGEHIVAIESGGSFRDKFIRLETAMKKDTSNVNQWDEVRKKYGN